MPVPREPWNGSGRSSIRRKDTPRRASSTARVNPAAPAPQISTSVVFMGHLHICVFCTYLPARSCGSSRKCAESTYESQTIEDPAWGDGRSVHTDERAPTGRHPAEGSRPVTGSCAVSVVGLYLALRTDRRG